MGEGTVHIRRMYIQSAYTLPACLVNVAIDGNRSSTDLTVKSEQLKSTQPTCRCKRDLGLVPAIPGSSSRCSARRRRNGSSTTLYLSRIIDAISFRVGGALKQRVLNAKPSRMALRTPTSETDSSLQCPVLLLHFDRIGLAHRMPPGG